MLTDEGWSTQLAENGPEAVRVATQRPDIVLLEAWPHYQSARVAVKGLRERFGRDIPIVAMSAVPAGEVKVRVGAFAFLQKPFDIHAVRWLLTIALGRAARRRIG